MPEEQEYDPRSLFEVSRSAFFSLSATTAQRGCIPARTQKLSTQKDIKREEWDDKMRMANQWRGLEADEIAFLRDAADEQKEKERSIKRQEMEELAAFKSVHYQSSRVMSELKSVTSAE